MTHLARFFMLCLVALPAAAQAQSSDCIDSTGALRVPDLIGLTEDAARARAEACGLVFDSFDQAIFSRIEIGRVAESSPRGGAAIHGGQAVVVSYSKGLQLPDFTGEPFDKVADWLEASGLAFYRVDTHSPLDIGAVVAQSPAPYVSFSYGQPVEIEVSDGEWRNVPDYTGKDYADAVRGLKASGFSPVHAGGPLKKASSSEGMRCYLTHYRAVVRQQSPASGELRLGATVDLTTRLASTTVRVTGHCIEP